MMKLTHALLLTVFIGLAQQTLSAQGIFIAEQEKRGTNTSTNRIQIDKDHMRAEGRYGQGQGQTAVIFDAQKQVVRMVDGDKKTYTEITKADVDQMSQQL